MGKLIIPEKMIQNIENEKPKAVWLCLGSSIYGTIYFKTIHIFQIGKSKEKDKLACACCGKTRHTKETWSLDCSPTKF